MASTNPKARSYFSKLLNKVETVEPIANVDVVEPTSNVDVAGPSKKSKKRDRSSKRSHSSSRRHRHSENVSSEPLPETIFSATTKYAKFVQTSFSESSYNMLKNMDVASLADSVIELSSRNLLIGKMMKEKNGNCVSLSEFEKLKNDLAEYKERMNSLSLELEKMKKQKKEQEIENEGLGKEISDLKNENLKSSAENAQLFKDNQLLTEKVSTLSSANESDKNTIKLMDEEINQLRTNVFEAESFIFEQHKLGFEKALQQAKYFYKIPIDEGNFDVKKDFYNGELVPANEIPDNDAEDINIEN
ncbi:uncharacterized protein [Phaseolus vulgaris]|uniref:uncharacterized protein n=1 Tax=Phaseolus vulgaris TaxID=3885 RepID=UPI0035CCA600